RNSAAWIRNINVGIVELWSNVSRSARYDCEPCNRACSRRGVLRTSGCDKKSRVPAKRFEILLISGIENGAIAVRPPDAIAVGSLSPRTWLGVLDDPSVIIQP
ncbi:MAG: hypothetical protein ACK5O8_18775, partial [Pirellula sp.]